MNNVKNIKRLVKYLSSEDVKKQCSEYNWKIPSDVKQYIGEKCAVSLEKKAGIEKNYSFFYHMNKHYNDLKTTYKKKKLCMWMINKWGGIWNIGDDIYNTALDNIDAFNINSDLEFERIASWSKYLTIVNPNKYAIYDTRIAFCLNALKIIYDLDIKYFPMPAGGRNKTINSLNMATIINLVELIDNHISVSKQISESALYYNKERAYYEYLKFLCLLNSHLFDGVKQKRLYSTEAILFAISVDVIPDLLINTLRNRYKINYNG